MRRRAGSSGPPGRVRIIGGRWRRRRLDVPAGAGVRPTPDRVRETLFNWLAPAVEGARCLDLYAGTGVLGFEALSRGAARAYLIERDARLAAALREQARALGADAVIVQGDAERFLGAGPPEPFDLVFLDPPYELPIEPIAAALEPWLSPAALVYVERSRADGLPGLPGLAWRRQGRAGDVVFGLAARA